MGHSMNRFTKILFGSALLLGAASFANSKTARDTDVEDSEIQAVINKRLPKLTGTDKKAREAALTELDSELQKTSILERRFPGPKARVQLSRELIAIYNNTTDADFTGPQVRKDIIRMLADNGDKDVVKPFALKLLDRGSDAERKELVTYLGMRTPLTGDEYYDKVVELANKGVLEQKSKDALLASLNKDRALPEITKDVDSAQDKTQFLYAAWALQDYYHRPEDFRRILPRIKEFGLDKPNSFAGGDGIFWIDDKLFEAYIDEARGKDLRLALELMSQHPTLCPPPSASMLASKLRDESPEIRLLAARALAHVSGYTLGNPSEIAAFLKSAFDRESVPANRAALERLMSEVETRGRDREKIPHERK